MPTSPLEDSTFRTVAGLAAVAAMFVLAGCEETGDLRTGSDGGDTAAPADTGIPDADTDPVDAGVDGRADVRADGEETGVDGGMCAEKGPTRIDCSDRVERGVSVEWGAGSDRSGVGYSVIDDAIFGERAVRLEVDGGTGAALIWSPPSPADLRASSGEPPVLRVAMRADNPNAYEWHVETPEVTVRDTDGRSVTLAPATGFGNGLPADGTSWQWLHVPLAEQRGWRLIAGDAETLDQLDLSAIEQVRFDFRARGSAGFTVDLDGLASTGPQTRCNYECPSGCHGRGRCDPANLRCRCEMGAVGPSCGSCGEGFTEASDGSCELADAHDAREWPNEASDTTGDAWLRAHHQKVEVLKPRVLVLNFANESSMPEVEQLVDDIVKGFELASTPAGSGPDAEPQLQYEVAGVVDMRNGRAGHPEAPADWPHDNSTLWPREETSSDDLRFDYATLFSSSFARHYGYEGSDGSDEYLSLCELVERGKIHDLWIVGAHDEQDAVPAEVLEYKQRYTANDNPIPDSFAPCAGNGCFRREVSPCDRSVRIGFINYKRGPGCYLHNMAHLMEWTNSHRVVPGFSRWFDRFAGMDLNERYNLPFESLYPVNCDRETCIAFPDASTVEIRHGGETHTIEGWNPICGNCHFPPNGTEHYDYDNETDVRTTCDGFGRRAVSCRRDAAASVSRRAWESLESQVPDCGGGYLVWWYRRMPAHGTDRAYPNGEPMKSVWPYLFY